MSSLFTFPAARSSSTLGLVPLRYRLEAGGTGAVVVVVVAAVVPVAVAEVPMVPAVVVVAVVEGSVEPGAVER